MGPPAIVDPRATGEVGLSPPRPAVTSRTEYHQPGVQKIGGGTRLFCSAKIQLLKVSKNELTTYTLALWVRRQAGLSIAVSPFELHRKHVCSRHIRSRKYSALKLGQYLKTCEIRSTEVGGHESGILQMGTLEMCFLEVSLEKIRAFQMGAPEVRVFKVSLR